VVTGQLSLPSLRIRQIEYWPLARVLKLKRDVLTCVGCEVILCDHREESGESVPSPVWGSGAVPSGFFFCTFGCFWARWFNYEVDEILSPQYFYWEWRSPPCPPGSTPLAALINLLAKRIVVVVTMVSHSVLADLSTVVNNQQNQQDNDDDKEERDNDYQTQKCRTIAVRFIPPWCTDTHTKTLAAFLMSRHTITTRRKWSRKREEALQASSRGPRGLLGQLPPIKAEQTSFNSYHLTTCLVTFAAAPQFVSPRKNGWLRPWEEEK